MAIVRMQQRRDTALNWSTYNPVLRQGELGFDTNARKFKIGDGETDWNGLDYLLEEEVEAAWKGDVLATAFRFTAAPTYDANGVISGGPIAWPDGGTGVYTVTSTDTNGSVTGFTATTTGGPVGTKTATVTIPRDTNSYISGAMTLVVS